MRTGRVLVASRETVASRSSKAPRACRLPTRVRFLAHGVDVAGVAEEMLGRVFDGLGRPLDGGPEPLAARMAQRRSTAADQSRRREYPRDFMQTGISAIDGMNTLVRGQKLPIFSASGLPHDQLAAQIVAPGRGPARANAGFAIVFAARRRQAATSPTCFAAAFEQSGALAHGRDVPQPRRRPGRRAPGSRRAPRSRWPSTWRSTAGCTCWS